MMNQAVFVAHFREKEPCSQSVEAHLLETAALAKKYAAVIDLAEFGELLGLLHDMGKYSYAFQQYIKSSSGLYDQDCDDDSSSHQTGKTKQNISMKGKIDHSTAGAQFVWQKLGCDKKDWIKLVAAEIIAVVLAGHHGGLMDISSDGDDLLIKRMKKEDEKTHLTEVETKISPQVYVRANELLTSNAALAKLERFVLKMKAREDAITRESLKDLGATTDDASVAAQRNEIITAGTARLWFGLGCLTKFLFSVLVDADRCNTIDFCVDGAAVARQNSNYTNWAVLSERLEQYLASFSADSFVNRTRKDISDWCRGAAERGRGIFTLTVPTGGGKTLSSMRFALELAKRSACDAHPIERILYVLPYTTIIDQNAAKAREILETEADHGKIVLECHSNLLEENETWEGQLLSENWDAPVVFTTNVQFLEALFSGGTKSVRRMHQLAGSIIIFDEIQALPIKVVHLFCGALSFLVDQCGATALLCTATQPLLNGVPKDYGSLRYGAKNEIIPDAGVLFAALRRVEIRDCTKAGGYSVNELGDMAIEKQRDFISILAIVNTTAIARQLYVDIRSKLGAEQRINVVHMSALMCPAHRKIVLGNINKLLKAGEPVICVSTQVMEAGIDVDFGSVIRSLAGFDSIVQAAGRCNREGHKDTAPLFIVNPAEEKVDRLIDIRAGRHAAERVLRELSVKNKEEKGEILSLENINRYFQYYFYERHAEMGYPAGTGHERDTLFNLLSYNVKAGKLPGRKIRQSFAKAGSLFNVIDAPTKGVIVQYGEGKELVNQMALENDAAIAKKLLHRAQRFSVNVYPYQLDALYEHGGIYKQRLCGASGTEVWILTPEFYSDEFGLSTVSTGKLPMEVV